MRIPEQIPTPTNEVPVEQPADRYTMGDIRELLRYKRTLAQYEVWSRCTHKAVLSVEEYVNRTHSLAFNTPQPSRLQEEIANTLAVFRRLLRESLDVLKRELDESALLYFVGEVADRHRRPVEDMWLLTTDNFHSLMDRPAATDPAGAGGEGRGAPGLVRRTTQEERQRGEGTAAESRSIRCSIIAFGKLGVLEGTRITLPSRRNSRARRTMSKKQSTGCGRRSTQLDTHAPEELLSRETSISGTWF